MKNKRIVLRSIKIKIKESYYKVTNLKNKTTFHEMYELPYVTLYS
jgi:hypothetical protein